MHLQNELFRQRSDKAAEEKNYQGVRRKESNGIASRKYHGEKKKSDSLGTSTISAVNWPKLYKDF